MNIICHIEQLLRVHDCVAVPGFGAFVASESVTVLDTDKKMIHSPSRTVMFNPELSHNDGLLAASIMRRDGLSYDLAMQRISDEVSLTHAMLRTTGVMKFGTIGEFRLNHDFLDFIPSSVETSAVNPWSFLPPLPLLTIEDAREKEPTVIVASPDKYYVPVSRNIFRVAASVAVMVALGILLFTIPMNVDSSMVMASVYGNIKKFVGTEQIDNKPDCDVVLNGSDSLFPYAEEDILDGRFVLSIKNRETEAGDESVEIPEKLPSNPYRVIVASLATRTLADKYISEQADERMRIHDSGEGRFRVYIAETSTLQDALAIAESPEVTSRYNGAWVSRR